MEKEKLQLLLSEEELAELVRMIYLAQYVIDASYDVYEHRQVMEALMEKVFKLGYECIPASGLCQKSLPDEGNGLYSFTIKAEDENEAVLEAFSDEVFYETISDDLAHRDFKEKYGYVSPNTLFDNKPLYDYLESLQDFYKTELEENGLSRFRVVT